MKKIQITLCLVMLVAGGLLSWFICNHHYENRLRQVENAKILVISKQEMRLRLIDFKGDTLFSAPIAVGKNYGNKKKKGDMCTPEGVFQVSDIQDASAWTHDFGDGKGEISGAYGPYFIRLAVPGHKGIGIHGTHLPESIGSRASEGCIRLRNEDVARLVSLIYPPLTVVITPSAKDEQVNSRK